MSLVFANSKEKTLKFPNGAYCVVPENIHTPHGGQWKFQGGGGF